MIKRTLQEIIIQHIDYKKAIVVLGPRQVGKTTLITKIAGELDENFIYINGDDPSVRLLWSNASQAFINQYLGDAKIIVIDEAQRIENIGLGAKMIVDAKKLRQLFISGSSSLEIANKINEPLTGRKWEYLMFPLSWQEISQHYTFAKTFPLLENLLVTGMYPEVITNPNDAKAILVNLAGSYLYKDILESGGVRKPDILLKLLQALAWQMGNEVSYNELSQMVGADKATVSNYIDLLEKCFVIFRLSPFSRNQRNEISSTRKIYFYDNGIRNTIINNLSPLAQRNDVGALWENFIISERKKYLASKGFYGNTYFWRNTAQAEIDYIEEIDGKINIFEIKWNPRIKTKFPKAFMENYQPETCTIINNQNFWEWL